MIVVIDNYDSFTYNLVHYIGEFEPDIKIFRNVELSVSENFYIRLKLTYIVNKVICKTIIVIYNNYHEIISIASAKTWDF
jgi:hypothetical protein